MDTAGATNSTALGGSDASRDDLRRLRVRRPPTSSHESQRSKNKMGFQVSSVATEPIDFRVDAEGRVVGVVRWNNRYPKMVAR